mmetsp:Transcript_24047/g.48075  ORF Transcript_24047/g.48075 Transcript_24047/m.48075 type:complete len:105 (-) Transcript_24047:355-669(-)
MRCQKMNNLCRCPPLPQPSDHPWRQVNGMRIRQYFERHADKRNLTVRGLAFTLGMRQGVKGAAAAADPPCPCLFVMQLLFLLQLSLAIYYYEAQVQAIIDECSD